jgi:cytochrome c2
MFAWLPSVGTSNLIEVRGLLPEWDGDLIVSTLKQQTLYRMRHREGRIVFSEPIKVGVRIRDIDQLKNGKIVLWTDTHVISEMTPVSTQLPSTQNALSNLDEPARQEASRVINSCQTCHSVTPHGAAGAAPNLSGVFGRQIAGTEFEGYSPSLIERPGTWNEETLDAFLMDPDAFAEGTPMAVPGIPNPEVRSSVIRYLKSL